ncbi:MAG: hypothetical protein ACLPV8_10340 [Steroidobacteraceae bacterium]
MPIALFNFARALKISRFTIDILAQRLDQLKSQPYRSGEESERFVDLTHESVVCCEQLHHLLRARVAGLQLLDDCTAVGLITDFEELDRKISESLARLNWFEYGKAGEI